MKHLNRFLAVFVVIAVSLAAGWLTQGQFAPRSQPPQIRHLAPDATALLAAEHPILLSLSTCPACRQARLWLIEHKVTFEERAIDESGYALAEALGIKAVPALIVRDRYLVGFHAETMREMLELGK
ncbi:MAG TPA: glutaredoxin family protein [Xanthomonadaceae bacterium]|nr:glutaredoxin family protein [Xanthomonadaceae bacterium]